MSLSRQTILLVEDDLDDARLLERLLSRWDGTKPIEIVPSGEQSLAYLEGRELFTDRERYPLPSLVFLDLKLPGISGFEVLTWLRQQPRLAKTQVVVLTGSSKTLDIYRAYELGANSYLVKPVKPEDLAGLAQSLKLPWLALAEQVRPEKSSSANSVGQRTGGLAEI
jgi:CheY-like chemotaxis protein